MALSNRLTQSGGGILGRSGATTGSANDVLETKTAEYELDLAADHAWDTSRLTFLGLERRG